MVFTILLSSKSEIKRSVVTRFCKEIFPEEEINIISVSTKDAALPEQPINCGEHCVRTRNNFMKENKPDTKYDLLVSIENVINSSMQEELNAMDVPYILVEDKYGEQYYGVGTHIPVPDEYFKEAAKRSEPNYQYSQYGYSVTVGEIIAEQSPRFRKDNWMVEKLFGGIDRSDQILNGFRTFQDRIKRRFLLKNAIIKVPDHPKPGVLFQDLSNILNDRVLLHYLKQEMLQVLSKHYLKVPRDKLKFVGLDARGFIYGSILAAETNGSFVMARKAGKLPGKTVKVGYGTEYSVSEIEMMPHLIKEDDIVIIVDDLVATGGSLKAAVELVEKCGGKATCCITVLQVPELVDQAIEKLKPVPIHVVLE